MQATLDRDPHEANQPGTYEHGNANKERSIDKSKPRNEERMVISNSKLGILGIPTPGLGHVIAKPLPRLSINLV